MFRLFIPLIIMLCGCSSQDNYSMGASYNSTSYDSYENDSKNKDAIAIKPVLLNVASVQVHDDYHNYIQNLADLMIQTSNSEGTQSSVLKIEVADFSIEENEISRTLFSENIELNAVANILFSIDEAASFNTFITRSRTLKGNFGASRLQAEKEELIHEVLQDIYTEFNEQSKTYFGKFMGKQ